jgi:hypothetical protein
VCFAWVLRGARRLDPHPAPRRLTPGA